MGTVVGTRRDDYFTQLPLRVNSNHHQKASPAKSVVLRLLCYTFEKNGNNAMDQEIYIIKYLDDLVINTSKKIPARNIRVINKK